MAAAARVYTGTCDTMTFEEAWKAITTGGGQVRVAFRIWNNSC